MPVVQPPQCQSGGERLRAYLDRLPQLWRIPAGPSRDAFAILLILAVCAGTAFTGAVHTRRFGHDLFIMLDGGWRVLNGQRPDVDFSPGIGIVTPLIMAAGLKLAHNSVNGVAYGSALVGAFVGLVGYAIGRKRMPWIPATLISLFLALIAIAPYPLGLPPNILSHAMVYNRYGYAMLGAVVLEVFQRQSGPSAKLQPGAVATGILSAILLFGKPSYGMVALVFAGYSVLLDPRKRWRLIGIVLGLVVGSAALMAWLRFDFAAVWNDVSLQAAAKGSGANPWGIGTAMVKGLRDILWPALLAVFVVVIRSRLQPLVSVVLVLIGGSLLLATNAQADGFPLNAVFAIILAEQGRLAAKEFGAGNAARFLRADTVILLVALLCFAPPFLGSASGLVYAMVKSRENPPESEVPRIHAAPLAGLLFYDVPDALESDRRSSGRVYVEYLNDGIHLIRSVSTPEETIYTLDMTNPFSYALERRPAHGGASCMSLNHHFSDKHKPSPEWLFGAADIVMVPKRPAAAEQDTTALMRNYLPSIQAQYVLCAQTEWWQLYKRPSHLEGCAGVR
ncbi:MAG: hypothetical protein ABSE86_07240 [Bryobacteraceae bacterium]